MEIDAVITNLEIQVESINAPFGHFVALRFVDTKPCFPIMKKTLTELKNKGDLYIVNHKYTVEEINEKTDLSNLLITRH